jgi:hypothetical protein
VKLLLLAIVALSTGCSVYYGHGQFALDIGTGKRTFAANKSGVVTAHSEIPQTLDATGRLAEKISEGAARGAIKGFVP